MQRCVPPPVDLLGIVLLSVAAGLLAVAHVALLVKLARERPRHRALLALFLPPLAPYFALEQKRYGWSGLWVLSALVYAVCAILASF